MVRETSEFRDCGWRSSGVSIKSFGIYISNGRRDMGMKGWELVGAAVCRCSRPDRGDAGGCGVGVWEWEAGCGEGRTEGKLGAGACGVDV